MFARFHCQREGLRFPFYLYPMLTYSQAFYDLKNKLQPLYDEREAVAIAHEVMFWITELDKYSRLMEKDTLFTEAQQDEYEAALEKLNKGVPLQYVTGRAWFMGREYFVNNSVLIPRPETEELVQWIISDGRGKAGLKILDIGTGSGCIPISLALEIPASLVDACDISAGALAVAEKNADNLGAGVQFGELDFLNTAERNKQGSYDVIVSNPPYIPSADATGMHTNVKDHEPSIALFVPNEDALVFYKAIADFGKEHLDINGYIYCELDAAHAFECKALFEEEGYKNVEIRKDMNDNWRMLKAGKLIG